MRRATLTTVLLVLPAALSGCLPIPYTHSVPAPDFTSAVPADLLGQSEEVLVLSQSTQVSDSRTKAVVDASFLPANELPTLNQRLKRRSSWWLGIASLYYGTDIPLSSSTLNRLCVLASDGREVTVDFDSGTDRVGAFDPMYRDAAVAAIRGSSTHPFDMPGAPCGLKGEVGWPVRLRQRIASYLSALPAAAPASREPTQQSSPVSSPIQPPASLK